MKVCKIKTEMNFRRDMAIVRLGFIADKKREFRKRKRRNFSELKRRVKFAHWGYLGGIS